MLHGLALPTARTGLFLLSRICRLQMASGSHFPYVAIWPSDHPKNQQSQLPGCVAVENDLDLATARRFGAALRQSAAESAEVEIRPRRNALYNQRLSQMMEGLLIRRPWVRAPAASFGLGQRNLVEHATYAQFGAKSLGGMKFLFDCD